MGQRDIAVIGIGCRYPGGATTPDEFWDFLERGGDGIVEVPPDRWEIDSYYDPRPGIPGKTIARRGGFIEGIDRFDADFFGISPREAELMDPQQRLLLETAWEALEDGGVQIDREGEATGVFVGVSTNDYSLLQSGIDELRTIDVYTTTGTVMSIAANRLSHALDLRGPSVAVDTACSSSLVAVHLAVRALRDGDCKVALAGGVNALLLPTPFIAFSRMSMLSSDGRCKAFDDRADGFVRSEGVGVVALERLSDALAKGRRIYAVIRGTAFNQDGHTNGLTVPSPRAQASLVRAACRDAGVEPSAVSYMEAHGTGTPVGDPIEATALGHAVGQMRPADSPLLIGSVKTNIGHLEAGAGVAGVIKAALSLSRGRVPRSLHYQKPTPHVDFAELNLKVVTETTPFASMPALVGVNSFGFGGSNAHAILESPPAVTAGTGREVGAILLPLSARTGDRFAAVAAKWRAFFAPGGEGATLDLADIAHSAATRRNHRGERIAIVARDGEHLLEQLAAIADGATPAGVVAGRPADKAPRPVFVYSGQGTQWWAMGRELLASEPVFRAVIERCDALFAKLGDWSLIEELTRDEQTSRLHVTAISQPAIFAIQAALTELWAAWGIRPAATVGHSVGEVAAAWAGGILTLEDAARVIFHRGRCMESAPARGRMIAAAVSEAEARRLIAPYGDRVSLGAINSPALVTLSGESEPLEAIAADLAARGVFNRFLDVQYAFHSAQMDPVKEDLLAALGHVQLHPARIPVISTVTATEAGRKDYGTEYWWQNVRRSVLFGPAVQHLIETGFSTFLEVGAHPALASAIAECLRQEGVKGTVLGSLRRKEAERATMLAALGALHVAGHPVEWDAVLGGARNVVALPRETWKRERFWRESESSRSTRMTRRVHPLLERSLRMAEPAFESELDQKALPWLADHRVQGHVVFPAAGSIEMMLGVARSLLGGEGAIVEDVDFRKALVVGDGETPTKVQVRFRPVEGLVEVASRDDAGEWSLNAIGSVRIPDGGGEAGQIDLDAVRRDLPEEIAGEVIAARFVENGINYGPAFRGIETVWRRDGEALGRVGVTGPIVGQPEHYLAHPALFDACLQVISAALPRDAALSRGPFLPVHVDRIRLRSPLRGPVWSHVQMRFAAGRAIVADLRIVDDRGQVLMEIDGFRCQAVSRQMSAASSSPEEWLYANIWQASPRPGSNIGAAAALAPTERAAAAATKLAETHGTDDQSVSRDLDRAGALQDLATGWIVQALRELGWGLRAGHRSTLDALRKRLGIAAVHTRMFDRFLTFLEADGVLRREGDAITVIRPPAKRDPERLWKEVLLQHPILVTELTLIRRSGVRLAGMLRGEIDPLSVLFPDGSAGTLEHFYQSGWSQLPFNLMAAEAVAAAVSELPAGRALRVLEVGAGTGGLTAHVLPRLPADRTRYVFTDASNAFFSKAEQAFFDYRFMEFAPLDIERSGAEQGFEPGSFDLVIASNVLHATRDLGETLDHVRELLAPRGMFVGIEINDTPRWVDLVFGLTAGWWRFADDIRSDHAGIRTDEWKQLFIARGFEKAHALTLSASLAGQAVLIARRPAEELAAAAPTPELVNEAPEAGQLWLLYGEGEGLAEGMSARLARRGRSAVTVWPGNAYRRLTETSYEVRRDAPGDLKRLVAELVAAGRSPAVAVHLSTLDVAEPDATTAALVDAERACASLMHLVQALTADSVPQSRLIVVTRGSQAIDGTDSPVRLAGAPAWGFTRVVVNEHRGFDALLIDLDPSGSESDAAELLAEFESASPEREVAFRGGARFVNRVIHSSFEKLARPAAATNERIGYRLEIPAPGVLDRLAIMERPRRTPGPGEVEIEVKAAALNFRDVMKALGIYPTESANDDLPGDECSGVIVTVADGVKGLAIGDAVVVIGGGCIASHVTLPAALVFKMPARLTFDEAVTVPVPFLTAWHALHEIGRIRKGETVLLHAATGGVGLAALQVAKAAGARVFATAGSPEKRDLLRALGVEHVMDSRTLAFADEVREVTGGRGVDIVLNSLSGRAIEKSLSILAMGGRFLEIGKRDIFQNSRIGMRPFRNNVSLQAIDLRQVMDERPELVAREMREVIKRIEDGRYNPLPYRSFPMDRVVDAFRYMARARHMGKVIVGTGNGRVTPQPVADPRQPDLAADATYMIVGGLGGFGLAVAEWLAERGARHLVLTGRRGATAESRATLDALQARGIEVVAEAADVTKREDVDRVFDRVEREMPPLRGILHAAMVLDDGLIAQLDEARLAKVMAPKVIGGWHLHQRSLRLDLDFFVLFSSISELVGNAGQANYVAANSFLVSLANHRHRLGLPALAIAWGRISGAGYVDRNAETAERLDRIGMEGVPAARATEAIGRLLQANTAQVGVLRMDWQAWARAAGGTLSPRLAGLAEASVETSDAASQGLREVVLAAAEAERPALLVEMLREQVAKVLRSSSADLDPDRPLSELGLDSLMAIDLLHRIENAFGVAVPTGRVGSDVTVTALAGTLLELITGTAAKPTRANGNGKPHSDEDAPDECLLPLRTGGNRAPLYLFHAAGGLATVYSRLVAALPADLPAVGLQSRASDSGRDEYPTIEAMGEAYAKLLSRRQPDGPLHLLGFSWGGYAALATAAALEEAGREVGLVTLLDSDPLWIDPTRSPDERGRAIMKEVSGSLFRDLGLVQNADDAALARSTDALVDLLSSASEAERGEQVIAWVEAAGGAASGVSSERVERFVRLFVRHVAMMDGHEPRDLRAPILSLRARGEGVRPTLERLTTGAFTEDVLDCSHYEILQPPFVEKVAVVVNEALLSANEADGGLAVAVRGAGRGDRRPLQVLG